MRGRGHSARRAGALKIKRNYAESIYFLYSEKAVKVHLKWLGHAF